MLTNFILITVILLIGINAGIYVYKAKKRGHKCIGCSCATSCNGKNCPGESEKSENLRG